MFLTLTSLAICAICIGVVTKFLYTQIVKCEGEVQKGIILIQWMIMQKGDKTIRYFYYVKLVRFL